MQQASQTLAPTAQEVKQSWNESASIYSKLIEGPNLQFGLTLARMLRVNAAQNILEVGCGSGRLTLDLLRTLPDGIKYTSVDISEEMIKLAESAKEELAKAKKLNDIDHSFVVGNGEDLNFIPDESVDIVIAPLCVHLTPDPKKILQEALRVLKKGGKIGFNVLGSPDASFFKIFSDRLKEFNIEIPAKRSIFYLGTREALTDVAKESGIKVDYCWLETVAFGIFDEKDVEMLTDVPSSAKALSKVSEEVRENVIKAMKKDFEERKKNFNPLQVESVLLVGRKPE